MEIKFDKTWTLFLDRDGVINKKRKNNYVKTWDEFSFIEGSVKAVTWLSKIFGKIIVVTNQRGVGRGLMTEFDLITIHKCMTDEIEKESGRIDKIYYCTDILDTSDCRKPNTGMAAKAKFDFPDIDFKKSVIVGDSFSDMLFGEKLGMKRVLISVLDEFKGRSKDFDNSFPSLYHFSDFLLKEGFEF